MHSHLSHFELIHGNVRLLHWLCLALASFVGESAARLAQALSKWVGDFNSSRVDFIALDNIDNPGRRGILTPISSLFSQTFQFNHSTASDSSTPPLACLVELAACSLSMLCRTYKWAIDVVAAPNNSKIQPTSKRKRRSVAFSTIPPLEMFCANNTRLFKGTGAYFCRPQTRFFLLQGRVFPCRSEVVDVMRAGVYIFTELLSFAPFSRQFKSRRVGRWMQRGFQGQPRQFLRHFSSQYVIISCPRNR